MKLRDSIRIRAAPGQVFGWLESLPDNYESWHPDHVSCRVLSGSMSRVGSEIECKEYLHGKFHSMRFRLTGLDPGRRIEYQIIRLGRGVFEVVPAGDGVEFAAEIDIGPDAAVIGWLADAFLRTFLRRRLEAMRQHMREEGQNLKTIMEAGSQRGS